MKYARVLFLVMIIVLFSSTVQPQTIRASSLTRLLNDPCYFNSGNPVYKWNIDAALHANGLLYVAYNIGSLAKSNKIYIVAINPSNIRSGTPCTVVAAYSDNVFANTFKAPINPAVIESDNEGNVFVGISLGNYYRLIMIPADTPPTPSEALSRRNLRALDIIDTGSYAWLDAAGMAVTPNYIMFAGNYGYKFTSTLTSEAMMRYTIFDKSLISGLDSMVNREALGLPSSLRITGSFRNVAGYKLDAALLSPFDIAGLPNDKFATFIAYAGQCNTTFNISCNKSYSIAVGVIDAATGNVVNFGGTRGFAPLGFGCASGGCLFSNSYMSQDGNLYTVFKKDSNFSGVKYNINTGKVTGITGSPTSFDSIPSNVFSHTGGAGAIGNAVVVDKNGTIVGSTTVWNKFSNVLGVAGPTNAFYNSTQTKNGWVKDIWQPRNLSTNKYYFAAPTRPALEFIQDSNGNTLVANLTIQNYLSTQGPSTSFIMLYSGGFEIDFSSPSGQCTPNAVLYGGTEAINTTSASAAVYVNQSCIATKAIAVVTATSTEPTSINTANLKDFDPASGTVAVTGLTANASNYIHIRLYDDNNEPKGPWVTIPVYVDTATTIGITSSITTPYSKPTYKDLSSLSGSSYTHPDYIRSQIGILNFSDATDPSGVKYYKVNDGDLVDYPTETDSYSKFILMKNVGGSMGADVAIHDGAGNVETRNIYSLTLDTDAPVAGTASVAFAATGSSPFNGEATLTPGTASDNTGIWGLWLASAYCGADNTGCPADNSGDLRWGAVPLTSNVAEWNLLTGQNTEMASGVYRVYARLLDGAGNPSATVLTDDVSVTLSGHTVFAPIMYAER